jgi:hypothetical protein
MVPSKADFFFLRVAHRLEQDLDQGFGLVAGAGRRRSPLGQYATDHGHRTGGLQKIATVPVFLLVDREVTGKLVTGS